MVGVEARRVATSSPRTRALKKAIPLVAAILAVSACSSNWGWPDYEKAKHIPPAVDVELSEVTAETGLALPQGATVSTVERIDDEPQTYRVVFTAPRTTVRSWCADYIGSDLLP